MRNTRFSVIAALMMLFGLVLVPATASAEAGNGVHPLRGRWDVTAEIPEFGSTAFRMLITDVATDPDDAAASLAIGCFVLADSGAATPMSLRAVEDSPGMLAVTFFGTLVLGEEDTSVARFDGSIELFGSGVSDDTAAGDQQTNFGEGPWSAIHHDRRKPKCPPFDAPGLQFQGDAYTAQNAGDPPEGATIWEGFTNIVSSGMLIESPSIGSIVAAPFTDLFSPGVDFVSEFRYLADGWGLPAAGEGFTFTLLDLFGNPIPGTTSADTWNGCLQGAPQNIQGTYVFEQHIDLSWDPVASVPGFDPSSGIGFYQIEVEGGYGANSDNGTTTHLIPWNPFTPGDPGLPDGVDFGISLSEFEDGIFGVSVVAFAEDAGPGGVGLSCQVRDEPLFFERDGSVITIPVAPPE